MIGKRKGLVQGIGKNDTKYPSFCGGKITREYNLWRIMLHRCSNKHRATNKAYADVSCSENFKSYTFFYEWCNKQTGFNNKDENSRSWQLDKDLLVKGNKVYSEDTCVFVPPSINCLLNMQHSKRGEHPVGVYWNKTQKKFIAQLSRSVKHREMLGSYETAEEAFIVYKEAKEQHIKHVAEKYKDGLDKRIYDALIAYTIDYEVVGGVKYI